MTRRELAIISAYTGFLIAKNFDDVHAYIEEKMGRPVFIHELPMIGEERIRELAKDDMMQIIENMED